MTQSPQKYAQLSVKKAQLCKAEPDRIRDFLRAKYPSKTAELVALDTGLKRTTVRQWLERGSSPSCAALIALIGSYGPALLAVAMGDDPPEWLSREARAQRQAELEARLAQTSAELAQVRSQS